MVQIGVFAPVGSRGWLISTTSPATMPTFDLNRTVIQRAEFYGLDFALAMIKLRGFGGPSGYWDHNLEGFTLMAGVAAVTSRIRLYASIAALTLPPALAARMVSTIDSIAPGRFGVNIVTGWQPAEYDQMGLWPGDAHFARRYDLVSEYVQVMRDLWEHGVSDFRGDFYQMKDCRLEPRPSARVPVVGAGQSDRGMRFVAEYADYNFLAAGGLNTPDALRPLLERLNTAVGATGRDVGAICLLMVIAAATDAEAFAKWERYKAGVDHEALGWQLAQASMDRNAPAKSSSQFMVANSSDPNAIPTGMLKLVGSYESVAQMLDAIAEMSGVRGIMLTFDDFIVGIEQFGEHIQPRMRSRTGIVAPALQQGCA